MSPSVTNFAIKKVDNFSYPHITSTLYNISGNWLLLGVELELGFHLTLAFNFRHLGIYHKHIISNSFIHFLLSSLKHVSKLLKGFILLTQVKIHDKINLRFRKRFQ